ncbi:stage IV sporulation protein A [Serpentinicella alkaliphila]|uniref:Stage IV sporulation protein A n=1 Tax=Serpentinicella alkaliphila TaxID=1734049 RepID=A0A4R2T9Y8_9FIRM|nr:stage IV sporulation protein A [Serpentinicella alkaliphila]QUH26091.1 stage IV sporulation protein A [Serpentinicella alkaliphila]TCP99105.1 stage IV sporulation protein A [Serpentinicella alkaliphila]
MEKYSIYSDIAQRTQGDIYIGVVGPVRTGKSTLIKRMMDLLVLPNIDNAYKKERAKDELPQSGAGKTITTTEPKFVPNEAVELFLKENASFKLRMIDCVGYLVDGALGHQENGSPRMVNTPWFEKQIPFEEAAEIGTKKVITEHSTIGLVVTTDGSVTDIDRNSYIKAEERVIRELKEIDKPFVIVLNTKYPQSEEAQTLKNRLEEKYEVSVVAKDCALMNVDDMNEILESVLFEFPINEINVNLPAWVESIESTHWLKGSIVNGIKTMLTNVRKLKDISLFVNGLNDVENIESVALKNIKMGDGSALVELKTDNNLFYTILNEKTGYNIEGEHQLIGMISELSKAKREYDKVAKALEAVKTLGYGVVPPSFDELTLEEPEIFRQGNQFGVKLRANAPSLHFIRADINTEVSPVVGTEKQSEELVRYLLEEFEQNPEKIWETNMFGKSLHDLVKEQLQNKLYLMPEDTRMKLQKTLQKIINEGNGLIAIIL